MCGIAGIVSWTKKIGPEYLIEFDNILKHRGPDGRGFLSWDKANVFLNEIPERLPAGHLLLAHRRLAIQDLSDHGAQPMPSLDKNYYLIFNGEIYNHLELKEKLMELGFQFQSKSDTEVLLYALIAWGKQVLSSLIGMFSFAFFDVQKQTLLLGRDHFGIKPLFYHATDSYFAFASEIKALLPLIAKPSLQHQVLYDYLCHGQADHPDKTFYNEIVPLPPGKFLAIDLKKSCLPIPEIYWQLQSKHTLDISFSEAVHHFRNLFLKNLALHTKSQVPISLALSGGLDSSSLFSALSETTLVAPTTFSYISEDKTVSEEKWVDQLVKQSENIKVKLSANEMLDLLPLVSKIQDQPFGSPSIVAQYALYQAVAKKGFKILLSGQGADELLAGYRVYLYSRFKSIANQNIFKAALFLGNAIYSNQLYRWPALKQTFSHTHMKDFCPTWIDKDWFLERGLYESNRQQYSGPFSLRQHLHTAFTETQLPSLLRFEDHNAMAHSIENRVPFLTQELVEFVFQLPESYLINERGIAKALLREALKEIVPLQILNRKDKIGFVFQQTLQKNTLNPQLKMALPQLPFLNKNKLSSCSFKQIIENKSLWRLRSLQLLARYC